MTLRAGALGLVLVCALTGCSGDSGGEPQSLPPVTPAPTTLAPSPTPSPSAYPQTPQGAADFARFFYEQVELAYGAKDPDRLQDLFSSGCQACARFTQTLEALEDGSASVEGAADEVLSSESPGEEGGFTVVVVQLDSGGATFRDRVGKIIVVEPPALNTVEMRLTRAGRNWQIAEIISVGTTPRGKA